MSTWTLEEQKAHRKLWVEALRSGKYEQGRGFLRSGNQYCCLGVLSDLAGCSWTEISDGTFYAEHDAEFAPIKAINFVGLRSDDGQFDGGTLARRNDECASFADIADIIESEPPGLFIEATP